MKNTTNNTPFMDVMTLIGSVVHENADGYTESIEPIETEVFCSIVNGCARSEFYEAAKAGYKITAQAEIYEDDYNKEQRAVFEDSEYNIVRTFPSGHGTLYLSLEEVVR